MAACPISLPRLYCDDAAERTLHGRYFAATQAEWDFYAPKQADGDREPLPILRAVRLLPMESGGRFFFPPTLRGFSLAASVWNDTFVLKSSPFWRPPDAAIRNATCAQHFDTPLALWHTWFTDFNYGHFIPDHLPMLLWLKAAAQAEGGERFRVIIPHRKGALRRSPSYSFLSFLDPQLAASAAWMPMNTVGCTDHPITVVAPAVSPLQLRLPSLMRTVARRIAHVHLRSPPPTAAPRAVVLYSRSPRGGAHGHLLPARIERVVRAATQRSMQRHGRTEDLLVFGTDAMRYDEQLQLFRRAALVIGPHGAGFINLVFTQPTDSGSCDNLAHVLEFVCGERSKAYAPGCPFRKTYYTYLGGAPWLHYHHVLYTANSTSRWARLDMKEVTAALDAILPVLSSTSI